MPIITDSCARDEAGNNDGRNRQQNLERHSSHIKDLKLAGNIKARHNHATKNRGQMAAGERSETFKNDLQIHIGTYFHGG
jgi:hypothetical protein